ncbi:MAG: hypothetical protein ACP5NO_05430, partial [Thermoplasmata archaeon]
MRRMAESGNFHDRTSMMSVQSLSAEMLAKEMLDIPEGMKVAIVRGRDGEGREFLSLSDPMLDPLQFPKEMQADLKMMEVNSAYTSKDI